MKLSVNMLTQNKKYFDGTKNVKTYFFNANFIEVFE